MSNRAIYYITRKKKRSLIILIVVTVIFSSLYVSLNVIKSTYLELRRLLYQFQKKINHPLIIRPLKKPRIIFCNTME